MSKINVTPIYDCYNDEEMIPNLGVFNDIEIIEPITKPKCKDLRKKGVGSIQRWIDNIVLSSNCILVYIGKETSQNNLVSNVIKSAWLNNCGLVGIYINNLNNSKTIKSERGANPFGRFSYKGIDFNSVIKCYVPDSDNPYDDIVDNIESWVKESIKIRMSHLPEW